MQIKMLRSRFDRIDGVDRVGVEYSLAKANHERSMHDYLHQYDIAEYYTPTYPRYSVMDAGHGQNLAPMSKERRASIEQMYRKANQSVGMIRPAGVTRGYGPITDSRTIIELQAEMMQRPVSYFDIVGIPQSEELVYDTMPFTVTNRSTPLPHYDYLEELAKGEMADPNAMVGVAKYKIEKIESQRGRNNGARSNNTTTRSTWH